MLIAEERRVTVQRSPTPAQTTPQISPQKARLRREIDTLTSQIAYQQDAEARAEARERHRMEEIASQGLNVATQRFEQLGQQELATAFLRTVFRYSRDCGRCVHRWFVVLC